MGNPPIIACETVHIVQLRKHEASSFGFIYHNLWSKAKGKSLNHVKTDHLVLSMLKSGLLIGGFHCHTIKNKNGDLLIQKV